MKETFQDHVDDRDKARNQSHSLFSGFITLKCLVGAENLSYVNVGRDQDMRDISALCKNKPLNQDFHYSFE